MECGVFDVDEAYMLPDGQQIAIHVLSPSASSGWRLPPMEYTVRVGDRITLYADDKREQVVAFRVNHGPIVPFPHVGGTRLKKR